MNVIINSQGTQQFETHLELAVDLNVRDPLILMSLAEQCKNLEVFCHISTLFAVAEKTGFIDEKLYASDSHIDWEVAYNRIRKMRSADIKVHARRIIGEY